MPSATFRAPPDWSERRYPVPGGQPLLLWLPRAALLVAAHGRIELAGACNALAWLGTKAPRLHTRIEDGEHYMLQQSGHVFLSTDPGRTATLIVQRPASAAGKLLARLGRRRPAGGTQSPCAPDA
ncbi:hypothetical protein KVP10_16660 [Candidimonas humi]|uniref:Uncharacterized protein n=1 Tax=Candidimonas humi TaxID=683355 RepID=A0ABV8P0A9_9BURK|nr:hypothetical protein [Candidimonas humi]MBV6306524.1 hypothetical protein [Candidimonas humi]